MLPREGMLLNPGRFTADNFHASLLGVDTVDTVRTYKLELIPRKEEIAARKMIVWVNPVNWTITKLQVTSWQGQKSTMNFNYKLIKKKYWLPSDAFAEINLPGFKGFGEGVKMPGNEEQKDEEKETKRGKLMIRFFDYRINTGLSDKIFEQE